MWTPCWWTVVHLIRISSGVNVRWFERNLNQIRWQSNFISWSADFFRTKWSSHYLKTSRSLLDYRCAYRTRSWIQFGHIYWDFILWIIQQIIFRRRYYSTKHFRSVFDPVSNNTKLIFPRQNWRISLTNANWI